MPFCPLIHYGENYVSMKLYMCMLWACSMTLSNQQSFRPAFLHFLIGYRPKIDPVTPKMILSEACFYGPRLWEVQPFGSIEKLSCMKRCQPHGHKCCSPSSMIYHHRGIKKQLCICLNLVVLFGDDVALENAWKSKVAFAFRRLMPGEQGAISSSTTPTLQSHVLEIALP